MSASLTAVRRHERPHQKWRPTAVLAWLVACVLAVAVGAAGATSSLVAALAGFAVMVGLLLLLPVSVSLVTLLIAFMLPMTQLELGVDTRFLVPVLLVPLAIRTVAARGNLRSHDLPVRLLPLCAVVIASITWSADPAATVYAVLALLALVACLFVVATGASTEVVVLSLRWFVTVIILLSAVAALTPIGQLAGRTRGIFVNPNGLALLLLLAVPLLLRGRWRLLLPVVAVLAVTTASRAGVVALIVGVVFYLLARGGRRAGPRLAAGAFVTIAILSSVRNLSSGESSGTFLTGGDGASLLRFGHSRQSEWDTATRFWQESPLIGHGYGSSEIEIGSSVLKLLVDLGLLGLVAALPFMVLLMRRLIQSSNPLIVGLIAAGLVNSFFEAWLLTAGSAFFVLFCLMIQTERLEPPDGRHDHQSTDAPASTRSVPAGAHRQSAGARLLPRRPGRRPRVG